MKWEAVFFDFDGVILDSVNVKTKAFASLFQEYGPEVVQKVVEYHINNGGVSRFDKFRYYYEKILNQPVNEKIISKLSIQFSNLVIDKVIASPFIPGAMETLKILRGNNIPAYIVSGTPEKEIKLIINKKGLSRYFQEVHGSPIKKWVICQDILSRKGYNSKNCLFIGDAMSDYEAARKMKVCFLGIIKEYKSSPFPDGTALSTVVKLELPA